jgi:hypothetical protein
MQNNHTGGIGKVRIEGIDDKIRVTFIEGGVGYGFTVGFYDFCESIIDVRGEKYIIKAICEIQENGNGAKTLGNMQARNTAETLSEKKDGKSKKALNIELIFPELPSSRLIRIGKTDEGIRLTLSETPNQKVALAFFDSLSASAPLSFAKTAVGKRISESLITDKLSSAFSPDLIGKRSPPNQ